MLRKPQVSAMCSLFAKPDMDAHQNMKWIRSALMWPWGWLLRACSLKTGGVHQHHPIFFALFVQWHISLLSHALMRQLVALITHQTSCEAPWCPNRKWGAGMQLHSTNHERTINWCSFWTKKGLFVQKWAPGRGWLKTQTGIVLALYIPPVQN